MSQLVTRCPHCNTAFHVNGQQLRAARGTVRCGSCLQVFRADENIVFNDTDTEISNSLLETLLEDDDFLIHDDMELDETESKTEKRQLSPAPPPPTRQPAPERETAAEPSPVDTHSEGDSAPVIGEAFGDSDWQLPDPERVSGERPDEDLGDVLKPDDDPISGSDIAPTGSASGANAPQTSAGKQSQGHTCGQPPLATLSAQRPSDPLREEAGERREPFFAFVNTAGTEPGGEPLISSIQPVPVEMIWGSPQQKATHPWLWGGLLSLLTLTLLAQVAYFQFDTLNKKQPWRSLYAATCPVFGCSLPQLRDPNAIQASNLMVRSHPQRNGALVVDAVLLNTAPYPQPFPSLLLQFTDLKDIAVASRRFTPQEYLQGELAGRKLMPPASPIHLAIEIVDPGAEAVNYELNITH
ncbi:DUF3426 domain-containing protein [Microbulbifer spongiae]|uniref:DUF3426 domain-containing protein n=1 Tax=Microbulbifer spongiae TaxID=2944933 RepID=A0ABY9ED33_9GAMM|nr:DUF3426 domain-containing protein [Microbulbifer sp. MI-G]WKD49429.1 DUF3426 domain-containing protein [Microbulbifer sp. MI-G]